MAEIFVILAGLLGKLLVFAAWVVFWILVIVSALALVGILASD